MRKLLATAAAALMSVGVAAAEQRGVTDTEILLGSHNDLSGPFAAFGAPALKAAQMYFDEINAKGGVHGRQIKLVVEDTGYQVPKAVQAANKLINSDGIFGMFMALGTPHNLAALKLQQAKKVPNLFPLSAAAAMIADPIDLKLVSYSSYYDGIKTAVAYMNKEQGSKTVCPMYIPSDFGKEIAQASKDAAAELGMTVGGETTHKPDETDYVGSLTKLKAAGCDLITVALSVRGTITVLGTAKKLGWNDVKILGSSAGFHTVIAKVPGGVTEGYYAAAGWQDLEARMGNPTVGGWVKSYIAATGEKFPGTGALLGRTGAEAVVRILEAAGKDLTVDGFMKAAEGLKYDDEIAGVAIDFGADHLGSNVVNISQVQGGSWKLISSVSVE